MGTQYDIIVSNPPCIADDEHDRLQPEVRDYEPRHALVADKAGLLFYERIAALLPQLLHENGWIALEFGSDQAGNVHEIFSPHLSGLDIRKDLSGHPRFLLGTKKSL
jgi:release factor glutamine methyltransferase